MNVKLVISDPFKGFSINMNLKRSFLLAIIVMLTGCRAQEQTKANLSLLPFSATNVVLDDGSSAWVLHATNGLSVEMEQDRVTLYFGLNDSITGWFDPHSKKLTKTLLEKAGSDREAEEWVTDLNADGVPDMRRIKRRDGVEIFFHGQWCSSEPGGGTNTIVTLDGRKFRLFYNGKQWAEVSGSK